MKSKKKILVIIVIVIAVAAIAVSLLMPEAVDVSESVKRDVSSSIKVTGNVVADDVETIYAPVSGKISKVNIKSGDLINAETIIAEYDLTLIENEFEKMNSAWEAAKKNYEAAVADSNKASARYEGAASSYEENSASMEEILGEIKDLEVSNRAGYLTPEARKMIQLLELEIKELEGKINVRMSDLNGAQGRIENASGYSKQYVAARAENSKAARELNAARSGIRAGSEGVVTFEQLIDAGTRVNEGDVVAVYNNNGKNVTIKAPLTGTIKEVRVSVGEPVRVRTTEMIMVYDTKEYEDAKASAQAQFETVRNNLSSGTSETINRANTDVYNATQDVLGYYNDIQTNLTKINEINAEAFANEMDSEEYEKFKELESNLKLVEQRLSASLSERQFQEGRMLNENALLMHKFNADVAEADMITAQYNMDLASEGVKAKADAVIIDRLVNAGGNVTAGEPVCTIQYTGVYKVNVMVSKYDIDDIEVGQAAKITLGDIKYDGEVTKIFPVAQTDSSGKPKVKVEVLIENADPIPTIGLEANVEIFAGSETGALSVPTEGVYSDDEGDYVYVLSGTSPKKQYVTLGLKGADYTTIKEGLAEGEKVITSPFSDDKLGKSYRGTK